IETDSPERAEKGLIDPSGGVHRPNVDPTECERKCDEGRQDAPPEDELVGEPTKARAGGDEPLESQVGDHHPAEGNQVRSQSAPASQSLPPPLVEASGGRSP